MKTLAALLITLALCAAAWSQIHVQVQPADTTPTKKPSEALDQTGLMDAIKMDAVVRTAELQLRPLGRFVSPDMPDSLRKRIADVMAQEIISLWNYQVQRALEYNDTTLLASIRTGLAVLAKDKSIMPQKISEGKKRLDKLLEPKK